MAKINFYLLRGLIREQKHWGEYPKNLLAAFPGATVNYLEIPGTGEFFKQNSLYNLEEVVEFCRNQYQVKHTPDTINVMLTISMGGMITSEWLKRYPQDFDAVVLINSSFKGLSPFYKRVKPGAIWSFFKIALTLNRAKKEQKIIDLVINDSSKHHETLKKWREIDKLRPVALKNAFKQIWSAATFSPLLKKPNFSKILILASTADKLCDYTCSVKIHHKWQGRIRFHQTAGHDLPTDDPDWITYHIKEFVQYNFAE